MTKDQVTFALWALGIVGLGMAVVMYQHSVHTGIVLTALGTNVPDPGSPGVISGNPSQAGASSRATGVWTPLGPANGKSVFAYNPPQYWQ